MEYKYIDPQPLLDLKQLDAGLIANLIEIFNESVPESYKKMHNFLTAAEFVKISQEAHSLKSSSANMGALIISQTCKEIEHYALRESPEKTILSQMLERLILQFSQAQGELCRLRDT